MADEASKVFLKAKYTLSHGNRLDYHHHTVSCALTDATYALSYNI